MSLLASVRCLAPFPLFPPVQIPLSFSASAQKKPLPVCMKWCGSGQPVSIPSNGRRPIVIKTAAEPHGVEAFVEKKPATVLSG
jgi:hypothetical protein